MVITAGPVVVAVPVAAGVPKVRETGDSGIAFIATVPIKLRCGYNLCLLQ